ncbi:MAG: hypothetical protein AAF961_02970 [Planctomycetota bacterium]
MNGIEERLTESDRWRRRSDRRSFLLLCALFVGPVEEARAALTLSVESVEAESPGTALVDVLVVHDDATVLSASGYNARVDIVLPTLDATFIAGVESPVDPLFPASAPNVFAAGDFLRVADNLPGADDAQPLQDGSRLFRAVISLPAGLASGDEIALQLNPVETFLFDATGEPITIDSFVDGAVLISDGQSSLTGDFDDDGDVDGADLLVWQRGGSPDAISSSDLAVWEANFGSLAPVAISNTGVPEPTTNLMCAIGMVATWLIRRGVVRIGRR